MREVSRTEMVNDLLRFVEDQPLDDQRYSQLIKAVVNIRRQLTGPPAPLPDDRRVAVMDQLRKMHPQYPVLRARLALYMIDCCAVGENEALLSIMQDLMAGRLTAAEAGELRKLVTKLDFALQPSSAVLMQLRNLLLGSDLGFSLLHAGLSMAGFGPEFSLETRRAAFHEIFLPIFTKVAETQSLDPVLHLESLAYGQYIKSSEDPDHHTKAFAALEPIIGKATRRVSIAPRVIKPHPGVPRVVFFLPNGHMMAHTEVLLSFLEGLKNVADRPIEPFVYLLTSRGESEISGVLQRLGTPLWVNATPVDQWQAVESIDNCRQQMARDNIDAVVFVSVPQFLAHFAAAPLAPVQIWWSMKFPLPNFPGLDGRVFYRSLFNQVFEIEGVHWRGGPLGLTPPPSADPAKVAAVRAQYPGRRILGTIAREEKIREPGFLNAVVRLLGKHPDTCFLWTGRKKLPEIEAHFVAGGVADRCHFVGWVDPGVYCRVFDLFLETYPLTGLMAAWSMALGKPVISVGRLGFLGTYLEGIFNGSVPCPPGERERLDAIFKPLQGRLPYLWADTPAQIDGIADAVLADPALAEALGAAEQAFITGFLSDPASSAAIQARHFRAIIEEKRQAD